MIRLTSGSGPVQISGNNETIVVVSHDLVQFFCTHCGGLRNGLPLYTPGVTMQEYDIKHELIKKQPRCLCKREVSK